jgi:F-type H+-transporting ATPase subunit b
MADTPHAAPGETGSATEHKSGGLPQFDFTQWPGQILWFLIIFVVLLVLMRNVFVRRIGGAMDMREDKISGDIAEARRLKAEAEAQAAEAATETAKARAASQKVAIDARSKAQAEVAAVLAEEEAKLAETSAAAEQRIFAARDKAMGNVRAIAGETAQAIVERLTGKAATTQEVASTTAGRA